MGDMGVVEDMALDGLRVLDFCRLGFGSQATLILGCLGAEVIRIESTTRPDPIRVMPPFVPEPGEQGEGFGGATLANANKVQSLEPRRHLLQVQHRRQAQHRGRRPPSRRACRCSSGSWR